MRLPFNADKAFWYYGRWCFVGDDSHGSRSYVFENSDGQFGANSGSDKKTNTVCNALDVIRISNANPSLIYLRGCWGIGKSSLVIRALSQLGDECSQFLDSILWIEGGVVRSYERNEDGNNWKVQELNKKKEIKVFLHNRRTQPLLVIFTIDSYEYFGRRPVQFITDIIPSGHREKFPWVICAEHSFPNTDQPDNLAAIFGQIRPDEIELRGLKDGAPLDEVADLIRCRRMFSDTKRRCASQCVFSSVTYLKDQNCDDLVREIRQWGGQHPYALQLVCYAVEKYYRQGEKILNGNIEGYVRNAMNAAYGPYGEQAYDYIFVERIKAELGKSIKEFLSLSESERNANVSSPPREVMALRPQGLIYEVNGTFRLVKILGEVSDMLPEVRNLLNQLDDTDIETLCIVSFPIVKDKFGLGMGKQEKINLLLDYCRRFPREGARLHEILQNRFSQGGGLTAPQIPTGGIVMDEMLALAAGLQFAYWFWNATVQPGMTRFSDSIGATLGEIGSERLKRWFGAEAPKDTQTKVDESKAMQQQRLDAAKANIENDPEWEAACFMDTTKRVLVALLRDPAKYGMGELQILWQNFGDPDIEFNLLIAQYTLVGNVQASIADRLVMTTIQNGKLPELIAAMRQART